MIKFYLLHKSFSIKMRIRKKCQHDGCNKHVSFGHPGRVREYCGKHKKEGMINLVSKKCQHPNCDKCPSFGYRDASIIYCGKHKLIDMINIRNMMRKKKQQQSSLKFVSQDKSIRHALDECFIFEDYILTEHDNKIVYIESYLPDLTCYEMIV